MELVQVGRVRPKRLDVQDSLVHANVVLLHYTTEFVFPFCLGHFY